MNNLETIKKDLIAKAENILLRRAERLLHRKIILFPWLRMKWLLKKIQRLRTFALHKCLCACSNPHT